MSTRLKDLIKSVRASKTAAQERAVISKECASIRTAVKGEDNPYRARCVAKLMYIHMLGYPTHWGQMECVKLMTSNKYPEKRVGYLGMMMLLDERQEVLTLTESQLQKDLRDKNQFVQALALTAIGNIASAEIVRDLFPSVQELLYDNNAYVRKKAALCAVRVFRKAPELVENFAERLESILNERNHGVLYTNVRLLTEALEANDSFVDQFRKLVKPLCNKMKNLMTAIRSVEHEVNGIYDPFLQVAILQLLRVLGRNNSEASAEMNETLVQVATNSEGKVNAGNAIIYECVRTIIEIEAESGLRVLAVNMLGRFLINRNNNIRYVGLNTLAQVVEKDASAVQRHRNTIMDCLKEPDISLRRRALSLIYALVNEDNVRLLVPELLNYFHMASTEFKYDITEKICLVVERYAPNDEWYLDTMVKVLSETGAFIRDPVVSSVIGAVTRSPSVQASITNKLFKSCIEQRGYDTKAEKNHDHHYRTNRTLYRVAVWCLAEYSELLSEGTISEVVDFMFYILQHKKFSAVTKQYVLMGLLKIGKKYPETREEIKQVAEQFKTSLHVELQQRSVEFTELLDSPDVLEQVVDRLPPIEKTVTESAVAIEAMNEDDMLVMKESNTNADDGAANENQKQDDILDINAQPPANDGGGAESLLDLDDLLGGGSGNNETPSSAQPSANGHSASGGDKNTNDNSDPLLMLFGDSGTNNNNTNNNNNNINDLFVNNNNNNNDGGAPISSPTSSTASSGSFSSPDVPEPLSIYSNNNIEGILRYKKSGPNTLDLMVIFTNNDSTPVENFVLSAAVPKYMMHKMLPQSGDVLAANGGQVSQRLKIKKRDGSEQKPYMLRFKLDAALSNGEKISEVLSINNFPRDL